MIDMSVIKEALGADEVAGLVVKDATKMNVQLDEGAIMPTRAHEGDAGYDLYAREDKLVGPLTMAVFDTGVHVEIPDGYVGMVKSKSGLYFNHGLTTTGVVDSSYTGSVRVGLRNHTTEPYTVKAGDKIGQLVILPVATPELVEVSKLVCDEGGRGDCGFGSTGR